MTVQQFKVRFNRHPHTASDQGEDGGRLPEPLPPPQGLRGPLPGADGPIPVPPGGLIIDPLLFDMPELRV